MGSQSYNDNVFLSIKSSRSSNNDNVKRSRRNRGSYVENYNQTCGKNSQKSGKLYGKSGKLTSYAAEDRANRLISVFNAPQCRNYFLKCIYHLSADFIERTVVYSTRPGIKCPVKYFNAVTKAELLKQGL